MRRGTSRNDRAVSTVLGYSLTLGITVVLISGLVISMGGLVENQRERAIRSELGVIGQRLAADVTATDRLVLTGTATGDSVQSATVTTELPETVASSTYTITLSDSGSGPELVLSTRTPDITVSVTMATATSVSMSSANGGSVRVKYVDTNDDNKKDALVIQSV